MTENIDQVVTRFAPSPTGNLHVGGVRAALFNYLFAKHNNGKFILRIEDTDKERSKKEYEDDIIEALDWLRLKADEVYRQSERIDIHRKYLEKLIEENKAYVSREDVKKEGDRPEVIRFRNLNTKVTFQDLIRGEVTFDTTELGDFVIAKDLDNPLFHLVVVVDDYEMGVTHLIRGEDHISNTPRQILIQEAIGATRPIYAHLPLVLGADRTKLSKRHGALSANEYKKMGYLPDAIINFLALIGWNPGSDKEVLSREELIEAFSLEKVQKGGAIFNLEKLNWINKQHMHKLRSDDLFAYVKEYISEPIKNMDGYSDEILRRIVPSIVDRISYFDQIKKMCEEGEITYYFRQPEYETERLYWKKDPNPKNTKEKLDRVLELLSDISSDSFSAIAVKDALWDYAQEVGRGNVLWPLRYALSGRDRSPDPFMLAEALGKDETIRRVAYAISKLNMLLNNEN